MSHLLNEVGLALVVGAVLLVVGLGMATSKSGGESEDPSA